MAVYLLHFSRRHFHAGHYLGYAEDVDERVKEHTAGRGARLTQVVTDAGIGLELVRVWENGDRKLERHLKRQKQATRLCPIHNPGNKRGNPENFVKKKK